MDNRTELVGYTETKMVEYGLSVSLNGSPRTPMGRSSPMCDSDDIVVTAAAAAPRKLRFGDSVSPRALLCDANVVRCLDFSSEQLLENDVSPVSFASASACASASASARARADANNIGDCSVCYTALPQRSNHVFTLCGHLFCVRCLLKWWDTSSSCPICRAELFQRDDDDDDDDETVVADPDWMNPPPLPVEAGAGAGAGAGAPGSEDVVNEEQYYENGYFLRDESDDSYDSSYGSDDGHESYVSSVLSGRYPSNMI